MDLHLVRRADNGLLQVHRSNDASAWAEALASGHAFDVEVLAIFPEMGERLPQVLWQLGSPLKGNWYEESLTSALRALLDALEDKAGEGAVVAQPPAAPSCLEELLEPCRNVEADAAVAVRESLSERLGKEASKELLAGLSQVVLPDASGRKRRVFRDSEGRALRLRRLL
ncbi:MAG: hypothetical protein B7Z80_26045 [Rhodospirillales bacterium 20-64-7]|nr:MAG: hypothetical protein B7Z80_26045 [Rhodospirillales bacterium 20-64-7]